MQKGHMASGTITLADQNTAVNVSIGFAPDYVKVINVTSDFGYEWWADMADAEAYKTIGSTGVDALVVADGITPYDGTVGANSKGFTIGSDNDVIGEVSDVLYWIAWSKD